MKVILLVDVQGQGKRGDIREVADGYANNFLIKKGLATVAAPKKVAAIQAAKNKLETIEKRQKKDKKSIEKRLLGIHVKLKRKANAQGKLYAAIAPVDIEDALSVDLGEVHIKKIESDKEIKDIGVHRAVVVLSNGVRASVKITVSVV